MNFTPIVKDILANYESDNPGTKANLARHGIKAEVARRYGAEGDGPSIYLTDPDGNGLELKGPPWPRSPH